MSLNEFWLIESKNDGRFRPRQIKKDWRMGGFRNQPGRLARAAGLDLTIPRASSESEEQPDGCQMLPLRRWVYPLLLGIIDDHSRLCCHAQWYLAEAAEELDHALCQALQKRVKAKFWE